MKLYELKRGQWFKLLADTQVPPAAPNLAVGDRIRLNNLDGMYSHCTHEKGHVVHVYVAAEVEECEAP